MDKEPLVVVVIPNWNGRSIIPDGTMGQSQYSNKSILEHALSTVLKVDYKNVKFVMVDMGSIDDSVAFTKKHYPKIDVLKVEDRGYPYGFNQAVIYAFKKYKKLEYIMLSNNDLIYKDASWLRRFVEECGKEKIGMVGCKMLYPDGTIQFSSSHRRRLEGMPKSNKLDEPSCISSVALSGGCFIIKREVLEKTGLHDELYAPWYWDEDDLWARTRDCGYLLYQANDIVVTHLDSQTIRRTDLPRVWTKEEIRYLLVVNGLVFNVRHAKLHVPFYLAHFIVSRPKETLRALMQLPEKLRENKIPDVNGNYIKQK